MANMYDYDAETDKGLFWAIAIAGLSASAVWGIIQILTPVIEKFIA